MNETNSSFVDSVTATSSRSIGSSLDFPIIGRQIPFAREVFRLSVVTLGLLLNGLVLFVVSFSKQLRYPRHVFWAAVSLVDCLFLVESVLELVSVIYHDRLACRIFVLLAGAVYSTLLIILLLAALDRYLALVRYEWYKRKVNVRCVCLLLLGVSALTFVVVTGPFWTGYKSVDACTLNLTHLHIVMVWDFVLGVVCVILHLKIFVKSRKVIRQYSSDRQPYGMTTFVNYSVPLNGRSNAGIHYLNVKSFKGIIKLGYS